MLRPPKQHDVIPLHGKDTVRRTSPEVDIYIMVKSFGRRRDKTWLRGFRQSKFQTSLLTYRDYLEKMKFRLWQA